MQKKQNTASIHNQHVPVLDENSVNADPVKQFSSWFDDARKFGVPEPEAMFLATAGMDGIPSGRMVLLKGFDDRGFVFYTNYGSRKGREINENPHATIVFFWKEMNRQVRITGKVSKVTSRESDAYFATRSLESRIGAVISVQSHVIPGRKYLEEKFDVYLKKDPELLKRPKKWGGFRIRPDRIEFWQERPHRLHDRILYRKIRRNWIIERLSP